jgi:hypothetical protein
MKSLLITLLFTFISLFSLSQETVQEESSLKDQFDHIYRSSSTYQKYKVIDKGFFKLLKLNVLDSLKASKKIILDTETLLKIEKERVIEIQEQLSKTQLALVSTSKKENTISLFGSQINKNRYSITLWLIIALLIASLIYFIFQYTKSNVFTTAAKNNLLEVEFEFEQQRKKSIVKEQKLRRQLQDEVNKQRNS